MKIAKLLEIREFLQKKNWITLNNYKNKLKELLNSSVKYRLISDVSCFITFGGLIQL